MKAINFLFAILITSLAYYNSNACQNHYGKIDPEAWKQMKIELQKYYENEIVPYMLIWKSTLDNAMTSADLNKLNQLRSQAKELRETVKTNFFKRNKKFAGKNKDSEIEKANCEFKDYSEKFANIINQVYPLAEKYESTIETLKNEASNLIPKWRQDYKNIWNKYFEQDDNDKDGKSCNHHKRSHKMGIGVYSGLDFSTKHKAVMFMLWNGQEINQDFVNSSSSMFSSIETSEDNESFKNFPNPFKDNTTISFYLEKEDNVKISVLDSRGSLVTVLYEGKLPAGEHQFNFTPKADNIGQAAAGVYYYQIEGETLKRTGKMLLEK